MKKVFLILGVLVSLMLIGCPGGGSTDPEQDVTFYKEYDNYFLFSYVSQTSDGGFLAIDENYDNNVVKLVRLDKQGEVLWDKVLDGEIIERFRLLKMSNGNYVVTHMKTENAMNTLYLTSYDESGNEVWNNFYMSTRMTQGYSKFKNIANLGGSIMGVVNFENSFGDTTTYPAFIRFTNDGEYDGVYPYDTMLNYVISDFIQHEITKTFIFVGSKTYDNGVTFDDFTFHMANDGNISWEVGLDSYMNYNIVESNEKDGYIISGIYKEDEIIYYENYAKIDNLGNIIWNKREMLGIVGSFVNADDESYFVSSTDITPNSEVKNYIRKLDNNCNVIWTKEFDVSTNKLIKCDDYGYVVFGDNESTSKAFIMRVNNDFNYEN